MTDQQLMSYFKFDEADLQANRNGQFTEKQKGRLVKEDKRDKTWSVIGGGFLSSSAWLDLVIAIAAGMADPDWGFRIGFGSRLWLYLAAGLGRDRLRHPEPRVFQIPGATYRRAKDPSTSSRPSEHPRARIRMALATLPIILYMNCISAENHLMSRPISQTS